MAPVSKEILTSTSAAKHAVPQSLLETKAAPPNLRPDAVSLQVAVKVHGTRLVSDAANSQTERFEEETNTMIVFPEGGVIRMTTPVSTGQMLVLTNLKSRQDAICRVAKVRKGYVEVEFTRPQAQYWGVYFPARKQPIAASVPPMPAPPPIVASVVPEPSVAPNLPAAPPESAAPEPVRERPSLEETDPLELMVPPAPPVKPPSPPMAKPPKAQPYARPTARLGIPDEIIPSLADSTEAPAYSSDLPSFSHPELHIAGSPEPAFKASPVAPPVQNAPIAPSAAEIELDEATDHVSVEKAKTFPAAPVLRAPMRASGPLRSGSLALLLDDETDADLPLSSKPERNWFLIGAGVALLLATIAGGAWYFQARIRGNSQAQAPSTSGVSQASHPVQQLSAPLQSQPAAAAQPAASDIQVASIPADEPPRATPKPKEESAASSPVATTPKKAASISKSSVETSASPVPAEASPAESKPAAKPAGSRLIMPAMKAHPLSAQRSISLPSQAPTIDSGADSAQGSANLLGLDPSTAAAPPPPPGTAQAPVRVGGRVKEPKLISTVIPQYPFAAKEANVQGDVVVDILIAANGSVARMKVVSGPSMLREAALNAVRRWKYQPSELDGRPVAVQLLVTIRFRL